MSAMVVPDESQLKVLRLLESSPDISQRELAARLNVSLGKANYCVKALLDKGFLKVQNFRNSHNKLSYIYRITPEGVAARAELTKIFLTRKLVEYDALQKEIEMLQREAGTRDL